MSMIKETIENIKNNREIKENLFFMRDELRQMQSPEKNGEEDEVWLSRNKKYSWSFFVSFAGYSL